MYNSTRNSVSAPIMDPRETYLLIQTVITKTTRVIVIGIGIRAMKTPAEVATPLPPLKPRNRADSAVGKAFPPEWSGVRHSSSRRATGFQILFQNGR